MDMEWNQALTFSEMVKDPVFLTGEIIQIGAIKLNQTLEVVDSFNEQIAPQYYTELHPKVAEITKLSNRDLQKGKGFHTVFNSFCDWCGDDFVFLVWGTEDLRILRKNMDLHNIDTSFMPPCFNLQNIFVDQVTHDTKQYALANALAIVGEVPFDSHDALNDARSTALLCTHLDLIRGLNEYKETVENRNGIVESYEFEEPYYHPSLSLRIEESFLLCRLYIKPCKKFVFRHENTTSNFEGRKVDALHKLIDLRQPEAEKIGHLLNIEDKGELIGTLILATFHFAFLL